jgi:3',5'-cyclic AMP phosphodiesterase CpdA
MKDGTGETPLFSFAIITDTHVRPAELDQSSPFPVNDLANDRARFAIAAIAAEKPPFVLHLGDLVHTLPHLPTYQDAAAEAREIFSPVADKLHVMPGNHDIGDKPNPDAPAGPADAETIRQFETAFGRQYHSFEHEGVVFAMINSSLVNSNTTFEAEQKEWLEKTIADNAGKRLFVCSHYPPFIYDPHEQSHYDNYAEPGRSWFLELVQRHKVEAVFSGHVHHYFFNRAGETLFYCLMPTSFIRQDYAEIYAIEPPDQYGRNDVGKFAYAMVDVYPSGHRVRVIPTDGEGLAKGAALPTGRTRWAEAPDTPLTVPLRHAWATPVDLPYNGPMEEFARKRTRNDYTLMRLRQMGIRHVRVPVSDLVDDQIRARMAMFNRTGIRFALFSLGVPDDGARALINQHRDLVTQLEIVGATDDLSDIAGDLDQLAGLGDLRIMVGKSHSSKHEPKQGSRFAHSVSSGFKWEARETVIQAIEALSGFAAINGAVMQINLADDLGTRLDEMEAFAAAHGILINANVRLADLNPATANYDDEAIARRVAAAAEAARGLDRVSVHLDTFVDVDRGYNPRHGLLDRHYNFRPAGRQLAMVRAQS